MMIDILECVKGISGLSTLLLLWRSKNACELPGLHFETSMACSKLNIVLSGQMYVYSIKVYTIYIYVYSVKHYSGGQARFQLSVIILTQH